MAVALGESSGVRGRCSTCGFERWVLDFFFAWRMKYVQWMRRMHASIARVEFYYVVTRGRIDGLGAQCCSILNFDARAVGAMDSVQFICACAGGARRCDDQ